MESFLHTGNPSLRGDDLLNSERVLNAMYQYHEYSSDVAIDYQ
jgi:hypothetical protein